MRPVPFQIHELLPDEWERFRRIRLRALRSDPDAFGSTFEGEQTFPEERWRERLASDASVHYVLHHADRPDSEGDVGLVAGAPYDRQDPDSGAGLFSMWLAPEVRGRGLAMCLIDAVVDWATERGYARLTLDVSDANQAAIRLYERAGFQPTGHTNTCIPREGITDHQRVRELG